VITHSSRRPQEAREPLHEWRSPAAYVGHVRAPDEKEATRRAIQDFQITSAEHQKRLVAERVS
jgi:hypothetical protein